MPNIRFFDGPLTATIGRSLLVTPSNFFVAQAQESRWCHNVHGEAIQSDHRLIASMFTAMPTTVSTRVAATVSTRVAATVPTAVSQAMASVVNEMIPAMETWYV